MAKRQSIAWAELRVGMLVIAAFGLLVVAIIFMSEGLDLFQPTKTITAYFSSASGMKRGADVRLEGVTIGTVRNVQVETNPTSPEQSVVLELSIDDRYSIPTDAVLSIGTIGLLGDSVVEISRADAVGPPLADGGELQGESGGDIQAIIQETNDFMANLELLSEQVNEITARIERGEGTLGLLLTDESIFENMDAAMNEIRLLVENARTGDGTIQRFMNDTEVYDSANDLVARLEALVEGVENGEGTLGLLMNDRSIYERMDNLLASAEGIVDRVDRGEGTLGLILNDDTMYDNINQAASEISTMVSSVSNSEGTAGKLINDPSLYDNFNQTASELLKLMYDFREDPGKFLTINFRLF
jgi:phospholipid/cholesterol/gamma-HCH transport system substrate-binding protein